MYPKKLPSRSQALDSLGAGPRHLDFEVSSRAAGLALQNRWSASDSRWRHTGLWVGQKVAGKTQENLALWHKKDFKRALNAQ